MEMNKLVFGALAAGCLAAAAAGGYLAGRQAPADAVGSAGPPGSAVASSGTPVTETEALLAGDAAAPSASPARPVSDGTPDTGTSRENDAATARAGTTHRGSAADRAPRARVAASPSSSPAPRQRQEAPEREQLRVERQRPAAGHGSSSRLEPPETPPVGGMWEPRPVIAPEPAPSLSSEPPPPPEPEYVELVIPSDSVLGLQIERTITTESARVEDPVEARVTRDVRVGDRVAIPAGTTVHGSVIEVDRGGKIREAARLGVRFHTLVLADGTRLDIRTEPVVRDGESPARESAAKIGGAAVGGAILGAILGGGKGALIGGATGAAGGTAATMAGGRNPAVLPAGATLSVRILQPVTVTVER
jgi:hypothetical protein